MGPGEDGEIRVGLTRRPGSFLGDAVYVELPVPPAEVAAGEPVGLVEGSSAVFEVVSPVSGVVVGVNPAAEISPETITRDPFGEGWLMTIRPAESSGMERLLSSDEYDRLAGD